MAAPGAGRKVTHVIFDMDGLLLDTEGFYTTVQQQISERYGKNFTWELKAKMMGKTAPEAAAIYVREMGLTGVVSPEDFLQERESMLRGLFPSAELMPGAERLIGHLHARGVPMAVATSSHGEFYELKTRRHLPLFRLMRHVVVGDDPAVARGKPAPDIFLAAAGRFQPQAAPPASCLVFEDAPTGVEAARSAGMAVVMVPHAKLDRSLCAGADEILGSLTEFDPAKWGLPPFAEGGGEEDPTPTAASETMS